MDKNKSFALLLAAAGISLSVATTAIAAAPSFGNTTETPCNPKIAKFCDNNQAKIESIKSHGETSFLGNGSCNGNGSCG